MYPCGGVWAQSSRRASSSCGPPPLSWDPQVCLTRSLGDQGVRPSLNPGESLPRLRVLGGVGKDHRGGVWRLVPGRGSTSGAPERGGRQDVWAEGGARYVWTLERQRNLGLSRR